MPLLLHAAKLPDTPPDYEFTVDHVTYKCYYTRQSDKTKTKYYAVYALPENSSIVHATVRLDWYDDLDKHIPAETGWKKITDSYKHLLFVDGAWADCDSLKFMELIANVNFHNNFDINTYDLEPLSSLKSLKNIFVTGGNWYAFDTETPYCIFLNSDGKKYYSDKVKLYRDLKSVASDIRAPKIGRFTQTLIQDNLDKNVDVCNESGLTPVVTIKPSHQTDNTYYPINYNNDGTVIEPLLGKIDYEVDVKELIGDHNKYSGTFTVDGTEIFEKCFNFRKGAAYEIITPNETNITEYGFSSIDFYDDYGTLIKQDYNDTSYFLPKGEYDIEFTCKKSGMKMRLENYVIRNNAEMLEAGLTLSWEPHRLTASTNINNIPNSYDDSAIYGIGEKLADGEWHFVPFDTNGKATIYNHDNSCGMRFSTKKDGNYSGIMLYNNAEYYLCQSVNGRCVAMSDKLIGDQDLYCRLSVNTQTIDLNFNNLRKRISPDKIGVIYDGEKHYAVTDRDDDTDLRLIDLLPDDRKVLQVFFEIDGIEYKSKEEDIKTLGFNISHFNPTLRAQSATIRFKVSENYNSSLGEVELQNYDIYRSAYGYPAKDVEIEDLDNLTYKISGLEIGMTYELRGYYQYRRYSDGKTSYLTSVKVEFTTDSPLWDKGEAQALTTTKARLTYTTNLDNVSDAYIEWRRVEAPTVVASSTAICPVVNGQLVGILNNLNPDVYYKFRPVYEYKNKKIYGEWVGIFTGDANVWFDPEVGTRSAHVKDNGNVTLRGSVIPGSGDVSEQGFELWKSDEANVAAENINTESPSHNFILCNGIDMSIELTDLIPGATYTYRAYAKVEDKIYTGPEETFTVPGSADIDIIVIEDETPTIIGYYNLQGQHSDRPYKGMNIIVYSNGKSEKRIFKE